MLNNQQYINTPQPRKAWKPANKRFGRPQSNLQKLSSERNWCRLCVRGAIAQLLNIVTYYSTTINTHTLRLNTLRAELLDDIDIKWNERKAQCK